MKALVAVVAVVVLAIVAYVVVKYRAIQQAADCRAPEIVAGSMTKSADTWHINFTTRINAPLDRVFEAFQHPERAAELAPENVMKSTIVKDEGNTKTVDVIGKLDILPPGFKVQNLRTEYTVYPAEHRITGHTIDFKLADISSEYRFEPASAGGTTIQFSQTSKQKQNLPTEALEKGALCETYLTQVRAVERALGLAQASEKRPAG